MRYFLHTNLHSQAVHHYIFKIVFRIAIETMDFARCQTVFKNVPKLSCVLKDHRTAKRIGKRVDVSIYRFSFLSEKSHL